MILMNERTPSRSGNSHLLIIENSYCFFYMKHKKDRKFKLHVYMINFMKNVSYQRIFYAQVRR